MFLVKILSKFIIRGSWLSDTRKASGNLRVDGHGGSWLSDTRKASENLRGDGDSESWLSDTRKVSENPRGDGVILLTAGASNQKES